MTKGPRVRPERATTLPPAEHAREIALRLLTRSAKSVAQLREALLARGIDPEVAEGVLDRYVDVGLLDDAALAASIARTRHAERGASARAIGEELRRKGFDADAISQALEPLDEETQLHTARRLASQRWARTTGLPRDTRVRRVVEHLGRKGYAPSVAFALVKDLDSADIEVGGDKE